MDCPNHFGVAAEQSDSELPGTEQDCFERTNRFSGLVPDGVFPG